MFDFYQQMVHDTELDDLRERTPSFDTSIRYIQLQCHLCGRHLNYIDMVTLMNR